MHWHCSINSIQLSLIYAIAATSKVCREVNVPQRNIVLHESNLFFFLFLCFNLNNLKKKKKTYSSTNRYNSHTSAVNTTSSTFKKPQNSFKISPKSTFFAVKPTQSTPKSQYDVNSNKRNSSRPVYAFGTCTTSPQCDQRQPSDSLLIAGTGPMPENNSKSPSWKNLRE